MAIEKFTVSVNEEFFKHLNSLLDDDLKKYDKTEHFINALRLYGIIMEGIADNKLPVLLDEKSKEGDIIPLPEILALLKYKKDLQEKNTISISGISSQKHL